MNLLLFLIPAVGFTIGAVLLAWLCCYETGKSFWRVVAVGVITALYEILIMFCVSDLFAQFYAAIPMFCCLIKLGEIKIKHSFV